MNFIAKWFHPTGANETEDKADAGEEKGTAEEKRGAAGDEPESDEPFEPAGAEAQSSTEPDPEDRAEKGEQPEVHGWKRNYPKEFEYLRQLIRYRLALEFYAAPQVT